MTHGTAADLSASFRAVSAEGPAGAGGLAAGSADLELFTREARKAGRLVLALRCVRRGETFVVECDTYDTQAALDAAPKRRAFAFRDRPAAERFVGETLRALEYLGCDVS